jgi:hypothetical protein
MPVTLPPRMRNHLTSKAGRMVVAMQLTTGWARTGGLPPLPPEAKTRLANVVRGARNIKVFRTQRDVLTLLVVTASYWFFSAIVWQVPLFKLIGGLHQTEILKIALLSLSIVGAFVLIKEPIYLFISTHIRASGTAIAATSSVLVLGIFLYWLNQNTFDELQTIVTKGLMIDILDNVSFFLGNCFLLGVNVILPALGCAFLFQALRHASGRGGFSRTSTWLS